MPDLVASAVRLCPGALSTLLKYTSQAVDTLMYWNITDNASEYTFEIIATYRFGLTMCIALTSAPAFNSISTVVV